MYNLRPLMLVIKLYVLDKSSPKFTLPLQKGGLNYLYKIKPKVL